MDDQTIAVRPTTRGDWPTIVDWFTDSEGRNDYTSEDFEIESNSDDVTMLVAENKTTNQLLGHIAVTKHGSLNAFVSLFHVLNQFKCLGIEDMLWDTVLALMKNRNILTDSPPEKVKYSLNGLIEKYNLKSTEWKIFTYAGVPSTNWQTIWKQPRHTDLRVCHAQMVLPEDLADFEKRFTNLHRVDWWRRFIRHSNDCWVPKSVSLIVTRDSSILGLGVVRPGHRRPRLGPLYALNEEVARLLLRNLMGSSRNARENGVEISVPECNREMRDFAERLKLTLVSTSQIYYTKFQPKLQFENVYALSNAITQYV